MDVPVGADDDDDPFGFSAFGDFDDAGPNTATGAASPGVAYALGQGGPTPGASEGDHTIEVEYDPTEDGTDADAFTVTAVLRQGGVPDMVDVSVTPTQTATVGSD